jgi:hypothetical protein
MADEVEFENFEGVQHALYESFPLGGDGESKPHIKCLVIQNEDGRPPMRVKADSPEADALRKRYPVLKQLDGKASSATDESPAPAAAPRKSAAKGKPKATAKVKA